MSEGILVIRDEGDSIVIEISKQGFLSLFTLKLPEPEVENVGTSEQVPTKEEPGPDPDPVESKEEPGTVEAVPVYDSEGTDLFEKKGDIGGSLEEMGKEGRKKIDEMRGWLKKNGINYRNFCQFLYQHTHLAGHPLSAPLIGTTQAGEPSLFKLAARYYYWWNPKDTRDKVKDEYFGFLKGQLAEQGIQIERVKEILEGEEIDPKNLPKGIEVAV